MTSYRIADGEQVVPAQIGERAVAPEAITATFRKVPHE